MAYVHDMLAYVNQQKAMGVDSKVATEAFGKMNAEQRAEAVKIAVNKGYDSSYDKPVSKPGSGIQTTTGPKEDTGSQSVRYRGSTGQTRVGTDTRVRSGTDSATTGQGMGNTDKGMAASMQSATGKQFADSSDVKPVESKQNAWQGNRTPVNLASVQQRVLKSIGQ